MEIKVRTKEGIQKVQGDLFTGCVDLDGHELYVGDIIRAFFDTDFGSKFSMEKEIFYCANSNATECKDIGVDPKDSAHWSIPVKCKLVNKK